MPALGVVGRATAITVGVPGVDVGVGAATGYRGAGGLRVVVSATACGAIVACVLIRPSLSIR